ncbi:hypothetical protein C483_06425 [Natrialba hulunbeirensis JCM 10989]|uniref:Uncharacterized protein n=1 Tax=Natrialba hulunbeirensis JCM 10989 TaxID=1227493 RepID=M0A2E0_9EURY|nr:hypothetical protein C483_06425 [Natrialba hulunbeirensis JCM 10989]
MSLAGVGTIGSARADDTVDREDIRVTGQQIIRRTIEPDEVIYEITKQSPELNRRYGIGAIHQTEVKERTHPEEDELPERQSTKVERKPWDSYVGKTEEWIPVQDAETTGSDVSTQATVSYPDGVPKYYFRNTDEGLWEQSGPINLISFGDADDLDSHIRDECKSGRNPAWTTTVADAARYLLVDGDFTQHEASVASGPLGFAGRWHGRLWNYDNGRVLVAAHEDSAVVHGDGLGHVAQSYLDAEHRFMEDVPGVADHYEATVDVGLDHNNRVSHIFDDY